MKSCSYMFGWFVAACSVVSAELPSGKLSVRVVDAQSTDPLAARIVLRAADGKYPGDRIALTRDKWPNIEAHGIFIAGQAEVDLPAGKTLVQVSCGPQYAIARREIEIAAGQTSDVELRLNRQIDLRKLGWVCGDAHLHMIHGEMQRATSYEDIALTCRANGLDWAYVCQEYGGAGKHSLADYHAECRSVSTNEFQLLLGAERPKSLLGHYALIGVADPFVVPDDPPYHQGARSVHAQQGVLFPVHPLRYFPEKRYQGEWLDFPGNNLGREIIFDAYLGPSFDGLSVLSDEPNNSHAYQLWFNLLNKGWFVPAMADSDACFDRPTLQKNVPGFWSTYLYIGPEGTVDNIALAEAVRHGQTMATTGPLVLWNIDGQTSGATIPADGRPHQFTIDVLHSHHNWTLEDACVAKVELIRNGQVVRVWEPNLTDVKLSHVVEERESSWYIVRASGSDSRWQIGVTSPIYFGKEPKETKQKPLTVRVRGRIYDGLTGNECKAMVSITRQKDVLRQFQVEGQFAVDMPLDAQISAADDNGRAIHHDLLLDYGPVHRFLWKLDRDALARPETLDQFESLLREVDLEFPLGYQMPGCYAAKSLPDDVTYRSFKVIQGPNSAGGRLSVAMIMTDKRQVKPGDVVNAAVLFHNPESGFEPGDAMLVVEARAYDPRRPSGFNPLKIFDSFEAKWSQAMDAGSDYRLVVGKLTVPDWVEAGPVNAIEINTFARASGGQFHSHVGMRVPLGPTIRALMVTSNWPTVPISWPDHNYGIGPLKVCGKLGRLGQPRIDYRALDAMLVTSIGEIPLCPERDCRACADADDAIFSGHFFDQILNDESQLQSPPVVRPQPQIQWRDVPVVDASDLSD